MKITYLINVYPRPNQSFIWREMIALERMGHEVQRIALRRCDTMIAENEKHEEQLTRYILDGGISSLLSSLLIVIFSRPAQFISALALTFKIGWRGERGLSRHLIYLAEACVLMRWLKRSEAQHLHAHYGTNAAAVAMLCHELGDTPFSFTVHGPEEFDKPDLLALRDKIERAAFVVAISNFGRSQLLRWCSYIHWDKVHVVRCGVDEMFLDVTPTPITSEPKLISVGRLAEQKGQFLLVEAASKLVAQGIRFELLIVGDGELREPLRELIKRRNLQTVVHLVGWMGNVQVRDEMLRSRALVLPSFAEGLPVVIMESLALHRPVVTTRIAGTPELVEDGVSGYLIPPGSVDALVEAMRTALSETPEKLEELGRNGARAVLERHNAGIEAARLARLFSAASHTVSIATDELKNILAADVE
jgi:colanic acid/amylovoran biosynthesis glycosyltransferase